jgi:mannosyltransferase OCH1-like enzyme
MNNTCDISNIEIESDKKDCTTFNYNITFIDDYKFKIIISFTSGSELTLNITDKHSSNDISIHFTSTDNFKVMNSPFKLILDNSDYIGKIPKIIHQSYTDSLETRLKNATYTWQLMNSTYKYMYWTDELSDKYIYDKTDDRIKEAYFSLYTRAYKSDILRLCILHEYGGIWTDISSECFYSFDKIINQNNDVNIVLVKDSPSQVTNGNIYQAFIAVEPKNNIIKHVLDITVDRVLNYNQYNIEYPWICNESIAVTGPTIFAIALNKYLNRNPRQFFSEKFLNVESNHILLLNHNIENGIGYIFNNDETKFVITKYENYQKDRTTPHYSKYFSSGFITKKKISLKNVDDIIVDSNNMFQIWITNDKYGGNYVSDKMYNSIHTWININPEINYNFLDNNALINLFKKDYEFPLLLQAYEKIKAFAFKCDLARYYLMYKFSGIYVDIDSYCVNNVKKLISGFDLVLSYDCDESNIQQSFIYSGKPRLEIFKQLINSCINNILNEDVSHGDLGITGPKLFGKIAEKIFGYRKKGNNFNFDNLKIKIMNYYLHLPLPKGSWINSSFGNSVHGCKLKTICKSSSGNKKNIVTFIPTDTLENVNGQIKGNTEVNYTFTESSGFFVYDKIIYFISKYPGYNEERHILGGNDFAQIFENKKLF